MLKLLPCARIGCSSVRGYQQLVIRQLVADFSLDRGGGVPTVRPADGLAIILQPLRTRPSVRRPSRSAALTACACGNGARRPRRVRLTERYARRGGRLPGLRDIGLGPRAAQRFPVGCWLLPGTTRRWSSIAVKSELSPADRHRAILRLTWRN